MRTVRITLFTSTLVAVLGAGCGQSERERPAVPAAEIEVPDTQAFTLRVAIELPAALERACEAWASERRARIEWVAPGEITVAPTLIEIEADALDSLREAGELRTFSGDVHARTAASWLADVGERDGRMWAIAWRARLIALRGPAMNGWADLARLDDRGLGLDEAHLLDVYLALTASTGACGRPDSVMAFDPSDPRAVEALTFFTDLSARARIAPADELLDGGMASAAIATTTRHDRRARWQSFPAPDSDSTGAVLARPRLLVVARGGEHRDLGEELATWLGEPEQAALLLEHDPDHVPLARAAQGADDTQRAVLALRERAFAAPHLGTDARAWNAILDASVRAAVERRRHPEAALEEAARWRRERSGP
jgi:hypothetical protein